MNVLDLWLPILLSGVAVFMVSASAWMVLPHHNREWRKAPCETELLAALQQLDLPPGQYIFPHAESSAEMKSDTYRERMRGKCLGSLVLWGAPPNMGLNMLLSLVFYWIVSATVAYLAVVAYGASTPTFANVFTFVSIATVLAYCAGGIPNAIWFKRRVAMDFVDGVVMALVTGAIFAALWPTV